MADFLRPFSEIVYFIFNPSWVCSYGSYWQYTRAVKDYDLVPNRRWRMIVLVLLLKHDMLLFLPPPSFLSWWRHQMETFSALLAFCAGNSPVTGEFSAQRPVTRSFDVFFDLRLDKRLSKQSWGWWVETPSRSLWRHCNILCLIWIMTP